MEHPERVIIVAGASRLGGALKALLEATPGLRAAVETCWEEIRGGDRPSEAAVVVLVGKALGEDISEAVTRVRERWPGAKLLVLADDRGQWRLAKEAGADRVHFKGIAPEKLVRAVGQLLKGGNRGVGGMGLWGDG